jgi:DNA-directed RNA polymerase subunit RPC12/RpoP
MKVKCPNCKYEWNTKTKLISITCPSCQLKFKIRDVLIWDETKESLKHFTGRVQKA